jgi:predicted phage terminase large subunit-like protein
MRNPPGPRRVSSSARLTRPSSGNGHSTRRPTAEGYSESDFSIGSIAECYPTRVGRKVSWGLREGDGTDIERCTWKAKYPTQEAIDLKRQELGDIGFRREMLLQVVPEEGQDVLPEDITYYDDPPFDDGNYLAHGVDLAISTKESADYTAIVSGEVTWPAGKLEIFIQPHPIIRHMNFSDTITALDNVRHSTTMSSEFFVEAVAYQQAAIEEMERRAFAVTPMHPIKDKRARLRVAARYIKMGVVKFPRTGCEQLVTQLLGFGSEKHDDAVDALVYLILGLVGDGIEEKTVHYV